MKRRYPAMTANQVLTLPVYIVFRAALHKNDRGVDNLISDK